MYLLEWRDERAQCHDARVGKELSDLCHPADVLLAVLGGEAEVLVQPRPDVVAVEAVGGDAAGDEVLLQGEGDRRLARPREAYWEEGKVRRN